MKNLPSFLSPLRHRNYKLWFYGQMFSLIGSWMQSIAQNWLIYRITNSPRLLGLMNLATFFVFIPASLIGGSLADRVSKRKVLLITQIGLIFPAVLISVLLWFHSIKPWHIIVLAVISEILQGIAMPIIQSFIIELTGKEDLPKAIPLNALMFNLARMTGPALAGILIAQAGEEWAFLLNGISFGAVIISLAMMRFPPTASYKANIVDHLGEGIKYVYNSKSIMILFSIIGVTSICCLSIMTIMPIFVKEVFARDSQAYGFLVSMLSGGAIVGGVISSLIINKVNKIKLLIYSGIFFSSFLIIFSTIKIYQIGLVVMFIAGIAYVNHFSTANTLVQLIVDDKMRGRVMSLYSLVFLSSLRFGGFIGSFISQDYGVQFSLFILSSISLLYLVVLYLINPKSLKMEI